MPIEEALEIDSAVDDVTESDGSSLTVGEVLHQERIRRDLSEKEVADKLHITMHYVRALESNCYEKLPGVVFVRGYIKNYALLLGLDSLALVQLYEDFNVHQLAQQETANRNLARRKQDRNRPWVILSIVGFIGGFVGLWGYYNFFATDSESTNEAPITTNGSAESSDSRGAPEEPTAASRQPIPERQREPVAAIAEEAEAIAEEAEAVTEEAVVEEAEAVIRIGEFGTDLLQLSFSGDSWIEISERGSRQIYRDIRKAGDVLEIIGDAPFNILLGDAPFARVTLNGIEIDVSSYIRIDNSARLTIGGGSQEKESVTRQ